MLISSTRSYDIIIPGRNQPVKALVPMIDMINFGFGQSLPFTTLTLNKKENQYYEFSVQNTFEENSQVSKKNRILLSKNGLSNLFWTS